MKNSSLFSRLTALVALSFSLSSSAQEDPQVVSEEILQEGKEKENGAQLKTTTIKKNEEIRRQQKMIEAELMVNDGLQLFTVGNYGLAIEQFKNALINYGLVSKTNPQVKEKKKFLNEQISTSLILQSELLVAEAEKEADIALFKKAKDNLVEAKSINPEKEREINEMLLSFAEAEKRVAYLNKVDAKGIEEIHENEIERPSSIKLDQAQVLYAQGRYTDAKDVLEQILVLDPYNADATIMLRRVSNKLEESGLLRRKATRTERLAQVQWKWSPPLRPSTQIGSGGSIVTDGKIPAESDAPDVFEKLNNIIVPSVVFDNDSLDSIVSRLKRMSKDYDPDPVKRGVNIILRVAQSQSSALAGDAAAFAEDAVADDPFAEDIVEEVIDAAPIAVEKGISLNLNNVPIIKIIELICLQQNLKYKVTEHAVIIADKSVQLDTMEVRFYNVPAGFLDLVDETLIATDLVDDGLGDAGGGDVKKTVGAYFNEFGVDFEAGAQISFIQSVNRLVVKNTPTEHAKVERILKELAPAANQIVVESKFYEVNQNDLDELAFEWSMVRIDDGTTANKVGRDPADINLVDSGLASGFQVDKSGDLTGNGTDGLETAVRNMGEILGLGSHGGQLKVASIIGDMTFNTLIHAIQQKSGKDILNAPKVTTQNGNTAKIRVVKERYFPMEWEKPEVTVEGGGGDTSTLRVIPSKPVFEEARELGVVLTVTPSIDPDQRVIELNLKPEVLEFVEFDTTFDTNMIVSPDTSDFEGTDGDGNSLGPGVVPILFSMPIFEARTIETTVRLWDGETLALGGLINERKTTYEDKIPYLGDIPFIGRFFTSSGTNSEKQNLIIFVTARLIDPSGLPISPGTLSGLPDFKRL